MPCTRSIGLLFCFRFKKKKDIRKFISCIEKTIIETLKEYKIETFSDKDNIGIWHKKNNSINKVAAIGVRVKMDCLSWVCDKYK